MAKKKKPRQLREEAAAARKQKYQQAAEKRQQLPEEQVQKETAEAVPSQSIGAHPKSYAKASGLKSVFVVGDSAEGNAAAVQKCDHF